MKSTTRSSAGWPSKTPNKLSGKLRANNPPKTGAPAPKRTGSPKLMSADDALRIKQSDTNDTGFKTRAGKAAVPGAGGKARP